MAEEWWVCGVVDMRTVESFVKLCGAVWSQRSGASGGEQFLVEIGGARGK